jgi:hypothetical protein
MLENLWAVWGLDSARSFQADYIKVRKFSILPKILHSGKILMLERNK